MDRLQRLSAHLRPPSNAVVAATVASSEEYDLVVRGGSIVDGTGAAAFDSDVGIRDGKIAAVGPGLGKGAREIDARGRLVTPGFVDVCVTAAHSLRGPTASQLLLRAPAPAPAPCSVPSVPTAFTAAAFCRHTHFDAQVVWDPYFAPASNNGATTVIFGNWYSTHSPRTHSCIWTD